MPLAVFRLPPAVMAELGHVSLASWQVIATTILAAGALPASPPYTLTLDPDTGSLVLDLRALAAPDQVRAITALQALFDLFQLQDGRWRCAIPNGVTATAPDRSCARCDAPALTHDGVGGIYCTDCGED